MRRIGEALSPVGSALIDQAKRDQGFDSPMLHQITKCRTRKHWRTVCTSDKFKGQLVKLSFKHTWDFARGFVALAETGTDDFDRILGDELDLELDPLAYPNQ
jgi:hypothetical protein